MTKIKASTSERQEKQKLKRPLNQSQLKFLPSEAPNHYQLMWLCMSLIECGADGLNLAYLLKPMHECPKWWCSECNSSLIAI